MMKGKKIADYINVDTINLDLKSKNKNAVIKELYEGIKNNNSVKNEELGLNDIYAREEMGSTGIGKGVALPHAKTKAVDGLIITFGISKNGIEYDSLDEENVKILKEFTNPYGKYIEVFVDEEAQNLNEDKIINNINKETLLNEKKARLYAELDEYREKTKAYIKEKFSEYIDNLDAKKEEMISQIEKNIERIEE